MGCDIHSFSEKRVNGRWQSADFEPFDWRSYGMYGFLAGVRNYSGITPISEPRGLPNDISSMVSDEADSWSADGHSYSWLSVEELSKFDYDATIEDRRVTRQTGPNSFDGGCTCEPGEGTAMTWREFLGPSFFRDLEKLKEIGAERIVFWFDN